MCVCIHNPTSCFLCSTKRGGDGLSHLLPHPDTLSREECTVRINRLRSRMRPRFTISLINGNYPKLTERFPPPPHPALADMKNPGEASVFFTTSSSPSGSRAWMLDVGCWMFSLRDFSSLRSLCVPTEIACLLVVTAVLLITWGISINSFDVRGKAGNVLGELISTCYISPLFSLD